MRDEFGKVNTESMSPVKHVKDCIFYLDILHFSCIYVPFSLIYRQAFNIGIILGIIQKEFIMPIYPKRPPLTVLQFCLCFLFSTAYFVI